MEYPERMPMQEEPPKPQQEIIVFTTNGRTFIFKNTSNFSYNSIGFSFDYVGVSTGVKRHAEFFHDGTSGYAIANM